MKTIKITTLLAALVLACNAQADGVYNIAFTDGGANVGSGQIDVVGGYAISGYFDVTAGLAAGNYTLYTAGGTGGTYNTPLLSPAGAFDYDNAVYDSNNNPQYPVNNPFLDINGLLFTDVSNNEVNLWSGSDNNTSTYTFDAFISGGYVDPSGILGPAPISPAPEPSSLALIALMLIPAGVFLRRTRKAGLQS
jgi:hypothetical protein